MTTAATPQDSPNTTLESGTTFKNWSQQNLDGIALKEQVLKVKVERTEIDYNISCNILSELQYTIPTQTAINLDRSKDSRRTLANN